MYYPELMRITRIFFRGHWENFPGFHTIDRDRVQVSPDFALYMPKNAKSSDFHLYCVLYTLRAQILVNSLIQSLSVLVMLRFFTLSRLAVDVF